MSETGKIIRGAGGLFKRNTGLGVGIGPPHGGDEGDIRVQMTDGSPKLYAKAGGQWYGINLTPSSSEGGVGDEFIIGGTADHIKITPENGLEVFNNYANVSKLGKTLRIGKVADDASRLEVDSAGNLAIINRQGTTDTTSIALDKDGNATIAGTTWTGSIAIGAGDSIFKADSNGIYLGDATFGDAEFRVTPAGAMTCTSGTYTGSFTGATWNGDAISTALQTSGSDNTNFYQDEPPTSLKAGDLWFDTDDSHKAYRATNAGDDQITAGEWVQVVSNADNITAGTLDCDGITVSNLNAGSITTGNLSANFISGGTLAIGSISFSGTISATHGGTGLSSTSTLLNSNVSINADGTLTGAGGGTPALQNISGAITAAQVNCTDIGLDGKIIITSAGTDNVVIGDATCNDAGTANVVLGVGSGASLNAYSVSNVVIGKNAGASLAGDAGGYAGSSHAYNVFIGNDAGKYSTSSGEAFATRCHSNTCIGYKAGYYLAKAGYNVFIGTEAGSAGSDDESCSDYNVGIGYRAHYEIETIGSGTAANVAIGWLAGSSITTSGATICIGKQAGVGLETGTHVICIGSGADVVGTNEGSSITIGSLSSSKGASTGFINAGGGGNYAGNNSSAWSTTSDRRIKKNIVDNNVGLDVVNQIRIRNFEYRVTVLDEETGNLISTEIDGLPYHTAVNKEGIQIGVIAQEIQELLPDIVKEESTGCLSVDSDSITWHLVNAVQELSAKVTALEAQIN